jgi:hypothetical protein
MRAALSRRKKPDRRGSARADRLEPGPAKGKGGNEGEGNGKGHHEGKGKKAAKRGQQRLGSSTVSAVSIVFLVASSPAAPPLRTRVPSVEMER